MIIYLRKIVNGQVKFVYSVNNLRDFSIDFNSPVSPMPLPEENDEENILMKIEGNTTNLALSWVIKEETSNTATSYNGGGDEIGDTQTIYEQMKFFDYFFVPTSLTDSYDICIADGTEGNIDDVNPSPGFVYRKTGYVPKINFRISGSTPITIEASISFIVGNVVTSYNLDTPTTPTSVSASNGTVTAGDVILAYGAPTNTRGETVTGYVIRYRVGTGEWETFSPQITTPGTKTLSLGSSYAGNTIAMKVAAETANGIGAFSKVVTAVAKS